MLFVFCIQSLPWAFSSMYQWVSVFITMDFLFSLAMVFCVRHYGLLFSSGFLYSCVWTLFSVSLVAGFCIQVFSCATEGIPSPKCPLLRLSCLRRVRSTLLVAIISNRRSRLLRRTSE